jgi:hypothetical protein
MEFKIDHKDQIVAKLVNSVWPESTNGWIVTVVPADGSKRPKTDAQRNAFHVWLRLLAEELNAAGLDQRVVFEQMREGVERPWTLETCKDNLWRPLQQAMVKKAFTEELKINEHDEIYSVLHRWLVSKGFPCPPWPNKWDKS